MRDPQMLGSNIRTYRRRLGLTQATLAKRLYVSAQNVSKWENGLSFPDVENLCLLSDVLGVSTDRLLGEGECTEKKLMIGIDGGGTKTEFCLFDENGHVHARVKLGTSNPNVCGTEQTCALLKKGIDAVTVQENGVFAIFAGIAGCGMESNRRAVASFLKRNYPGVRVEVKNDAYSVIYSTVHHEKCMMVIMGTGAVVFAKNGDTLSRVGGWGYLLDEGFSGYAIGKDAVMAALAAEDRIGEPTALLEMLRGVFGKSVFEGLPVFYGMPKEEVAALAKLVFAARAQGDAVANEILHRRAGVLRRWLERAASLYDAGTQVILAGGLTNERETVLSLLDCDRFDFEIPTLPPIFGACNYCARMLGECGEGFAAEFERSYTEMIKE